MLQTTGWNVAGNWFLSCFSQTGSHQVLLSCSLTRYCEGVTLNSSLKALVKIFGLLNPTLYAISAIDIQCRWIKGFVRTQIGAKCNRLCPHNRKPWLNSTALNRHSAFLMQLGRPFQMHATYKLNRHFASDRKNFSIQGNMVHKHIPAETFDRNSALFMFFSTSSKIIMLTLRKNGKWS